MKMHKLTKNLFTCSAKETFAEHVVKRFLVSFHVLYFMLNPMDKLFTAWKSYFIVIFTDNSREVISK